MNLVRKFLKTSKIYFLGKALSFIVTFIMLKVYTANITTEGYGYYDLVVSYIQSLIPFLFIEIWSGMLRRVILHKDIHEKRQTITTSLVFLLVTLFVYSIGYLTVSMFFSFKGCFLIFLYSISYLFFSFFSILARALEKNKLFAVSGILGSFGNALIGLLAILVFHLDFEALFLSLIANYLVQSTIVFVNTKCWGFFNFSYFSKKEARELVRFCLPLALNTLVNYAYTGLYRTIINNKLGTDILGLYSVSIKFAAIVTLVGTIFHLAWQEISYSISEENNKTEVYISGLKAFGYVISICCSIILPLIKCIFPIFIGSAFAEAANFVPYYYLYIYFFMINGFMYNVLSAENETNKLFAGKLVGTVVLLLLICLLLPKLEIIAIPVSIVLASAVEYSFLRVYLHRKHNIKFFNHSLIISIIMYLLGCMVYVKFDIVSNGIWLLFAFAITIFVIYLQNKKIVKAVLKTTIHKKA